MSRALRKLVRERAGGICEYCQLPDVVVQTSLFHVEHVEPKKHGGLNETDNYAWSCHRCNLHKGSNLSGKDPLTENVVLLFHPRQQAWKRHFEWQGALLIGRTQTGRATVAVLNINDPKRIEIRQLLMDNEDWLDA